MDDLLASDNVSERGVAVGDGDEGLEEFDEPGRVENETVLESRRMRVVDDLAPRVEELSDVCDLLGLELVRNTPSSKLFKVYQLVHGLLFFDKVDEARIRLRHLDHLLRLDLVRDIANDFVGEKVA